MFSADDNFAESEVIVLAVCGVGRAWVLLKRRVADTSIVFLVRARTAVQNEVAALCAVVESARD